MGILKFIKSLFIKDEKIEAPVAEETKVAETVVKPAAAVIKRKKVVKRKKNVNAT